MRTIVLALAIFLAALSQRNIFAARTIYAGGFIVDPNATDSPRAADVAIEGGKISAVGSALPRENAQVIDVSRKYLVPGLWDMHAHVAAVGPVGDALEDYVRHGVLGIRDMGGRVDEILTLRSEINAGKRLGPAMFVAGPTLNGEQAADFHRVIRNAEQARAAVHELKQRGVDFIKIHRQTSRDAFNGVREQAQREGLDFAGHVPLMMDWIEGANGGMRSIEHIQTIIENEIDRSAKDPIKATFETLTKLEGARGDAIFQAMARHHTYWDPTLVFYESSWSEDPPERQQLKKRAYAQMRPFVGRAFAAGVPILVGTDLLARRGEGVLDELDQLVAAGLTPAQALAAGTVIPFGLTHRGPGPITPGNEASFLVVESDPRSHLATLRQPTHIVLRGEELPR